MIAAFVIHSNAQNETNETFNEFSSYFFLVLKFIIVNMGEKNTIFLRNEICCFV